ncbi:MAG: AraC family transcriptional regulator [Drouetiella hepatica Uher 2000/2452]|jgi:AraC-like DNA-binding protein|uniref:AraC family transcriptional regulator n=1 Tax=Drouetiella hepatica Uher 2000/2452 TaxID=904376 RepID=A0A951UNQ6_9CYAN|nr:AraC family transcriptional regulator [Drouetiella hepatica Uher 2000/2452]
MKIAIPSASRTNILTTAELDALFEQAQQQGESIFQRTASEVRVNLPKQLGSGGDRIIHLRGGLTLHIRNGKLWETTQMEQQHAPVFPLTAKFYLSGSSRVQTQGISGIQSDYEEVAGCHYLYHLPDVKEIEEWQAHELNQVVMIYAEVDYFRSFNWAGNDLPRPLQALMQSNVIQRFHQSLGKTTLSMQQVLQQIIHCPYQGIMQQLYLEGKALELLTLQFAHWTATDRSTELSLSREALLRSDDIEQLHHAREILIQHSTQPPSLIELARQVGINDRKLKQGFRQLFGTTVFGYLHDYRMQQAKQLLHDSDLSIAAIATTIGYSNPEAFSTAFRRKFAVSPKAYQLSQRF